MAPTRVLVHGITGRMGREVLTALCRTPDMVPVGGVCLHPGEASHSLPDGSGSIPLSSDVGDAMRSTAPDVMVDFTNAAASISASLQAAALGIHCVIGSSGLGEEDYQELDSAAKEFGVGIIVAPNFAIGAIVLDKLVAQAAPFFEYADIIESHHEAKIDAPSGTAIALAKAMTGVKEFQRNKTEREPIPGARGAEHGGIGIHSVRMAGRSAHHEVIFGTTGQTLSLRHDTLGRDCYMPGVLQAIREVVNRKGLVIGLENILDL